MAARRQRFHEHEAEVSYRLQVIGAREGFLKGSLISGPLMIFAHYRYPFVRRQTLAGKCFLALWGSIAGMAYYSDKYLLEWEKAHRAESEKWRTQARKELAATGIVPSEKDMMRWKERTDETRASQLAQQEAAAPPPPPPSGSSQ